MTEPTTRLQLRVSPGAALSVVSGRASRDEIAELRGLGRSETDRPPARR